MNQVTLAKYLDFANHHQEATEETIKSLCRDVLTFGFNSAFVNPCYVALAREQLANQAKVGTVVSFPLGQELLAIKLAQVEAVIKVGVEELDVSLNIGYLKSAQWEKAEEETKRIVNQAKTQNPEVVVKLIIETGCLTEGEIKKASELVWSSGADFIKTCSGFGPRGATLEDVELIKEAVGDKIKIKVAGGIDTLQEAMAFINKGVSRIGTSQAVQIIQEFEGF